jgi:uncharacterized protein (DUF1697 family)
MAGRCVALLRGINVGRAKRVAMADLRQVASDLGYLDPRTLLNSGNLVFTIPAGDRRDPAPRLEQAIATRLKVASRVTVLTAAELAGIVEQHPLAAIATNPSRLLVTVLTEPSARARLLPLSREEWHPDALALGKRVAYLWCGGGILESRLATAVSRALGDGATSRNWATILKLHQLVSEAS